MFTFWERVGLLRGVTLHTKTGKPFQVASVDERYVTVIPAQTGTPRPIRRIEVEAAYDLHIPWEELTATRLVKDRVTAVNPVYIVSILKAVEGITDEVALPKSSVTIIPEQVTIEEFISQLERLAHLHHLGLISNEDFSQAKLRLLKATE